MVFILGVVIGRVFNNKDNIQTKKGIGSNPPSKNSSPGPPGKIKGSD